MDNNESESQMTRYDNPEQNAELAEYSGNIADQQHSESTLERCDKFLQKNHKVVDKTVTVVSQLAEVCRENKRLNAQVDAFKEMSKVKLAQMDHKFKASQDIVEKTFAERDKALSQFNKVLDKAIESDNDEMIIQAMHQIGNVVTSSPLEDIAKINKAFDDPNVPLFDF